MISFRLFIISCVTSLSLPSFAQLSPDHFVSQDKGDIKAFVGNKEYKGERKIYKGEELTTIGMPVGGICAGQLYVRGDGTLANWWIANNAYNTGYGIDWLLNFETPLGPWNVCYQTFEPASYIDQGFKIMVKDGNNVTVRELSKKDFDDISFIGEYPIAYVEYGQKKSDLPVKVSAEFFSPFIPLDARNSATPATVMKYTVTNTSDRTITANLMGWMQNLVCIDLKGRADGMLQNKVVNNDGWKSVYMDMRVDNLPAKPEPKPRKAQSFDNFESGTFNRWKVEGTAFGNKPANGPQCNQNSFGGEYGNFLANSYTNYDKPTGKLTSNPFTIKNKFISFNIAGGSHPGKTCMNLIVDGKIVMTATGSNNEDFLPHNWNVSKYRGKKAYLEIIDDYDGSWGHISVDNIEFSDTPIPQPSVNIDKDHAFFGNLALSVFDDTATATADDTKKEIEYAEAELGEKLNGALTSSMTLNPGECRSVVFVLSWYFPNRPLNYAGGDWNKPIPFDGPAIGNMYSNWYDSSLDVAEHLQKNYSDLTEKTYAFHDTYYNQTTLPYWLMQRIMMPVSTLATETCQWWATDKFWAWEGVGSCEGTCTHVWGYAQALAALFPELERNLREKTDYSVSLMDNGAILSRNGRHGILIDGHASVILRMYREHLMSKNNLFLSRNWDKIKRSLQYIINEDENEDGLIVKTQPNTYDISFNGANTYVGSLYLAALRAGEKMAEIMNDTVAANYYKKIYIAGSENTMDRLWNGEYFYQDVDEKEYPKFQYGNGCLSDQLFGQTWASLLRLGDIYPTDAINKALKSIWKFNWTNDVKAQSEAHLPERYYAHNGEPGLFICTWPFDKHPGENGVRYRDEVWTGIEYQVATEMINRGMIDEGLAIVKGVHSRYDGTHHNPWNEVECGDHYARALASYGVLQAIQGYWYDGPNGTIGFNPGIQKNDIVGFFHAAEGWGNISQKRNNGRQTNSVEVKYGRLYLDKLQVCLPDNLQGRTVKAKLNSKDIPVIIADVDGYTEVSLNGLILKSGDKLLIDFE